MVVVFEVEYDAHTEREARLRAQRDAERLFQQDDVLSVNVDAKRPPSELYPITSAYLNERKVTDRVNEYVPGRMSVDESIDEALRGRS